MSEHRIANEDMERIPIDKLAHCFGVSIERALAAQADIGFMYRQLAVAPSQPDAAEIAVLRAKAAAYDRCRDKIDCISRGEALITPDMVHEWNRWKG